MDTDELEQRKSCPTLSGYTDFTGGNRSERRVRKMEAEKFARLAQTFPPQSIHHFYVSNFSVSSSFALRPYVKSVQFLVKSLCSVRSFAANSGFGCWRFGAVLTVLFGLS